LVIGNKIGVSVEYEVLPPIYRKYFGSEIPVILDDALQSIETLYGRIDTRERHNGGCYVADGDATGRTGLMHVELFWSKTVSPLILVMPPPPPQHTYPLTHRMWRNQH
jgi:hypothetical protein